MQGLFVRGSLRRRVIALAAAYLIALAGLFASFGVASAAATAQSGILICHTSGGGQSSPDDRTDTALCAELCGIGCLMLTAALPPPPATAAPLPQAASQSLPAIAVARLFAAPAAKSHRSRAPPSAA